MLEIINEKFYDIVNKVEEIEKETPKVADIFKDVLELFTLMMERQNQANEHFDTNIMGLAGDMNNLHMEVINHKNTSCCGSGNCGTSSKQPTNQELQMSDDILDIASFIVGDNNGYKDYINNKRNEAKEFVKSVNGDVDEEDLSKDIATLSNFIEKKLRK